MDNLKDINGTKSIQNSVSDPREDTACLYISVGGALVKPSLDDQVLQLVNDVEPALVPGRHYSARDLCGDDFWFSLEKGDRLNAGKCLVDLVRKGRVPLRSVGTNGANLALYEFSK